MQHFRTLRRGKERNPLRNQNTRTWCLIYFWGWVKKKKTITRYAPVFISYVLFLAGAPQKSPPSPIHVCFQTGIWSPHERQAPKRERERERHTHSSCERFCNSVSPPTPSKTRLHSSPAPYITHAALFMTPTIVIRLPNNPSAPSTHYLLLAPPPFLTWPQNQSEPWQSSNIMLCCVGFSSSFSPLVFMYDGNISRSVYLLKTLHPCMIRKPPNRTESSEWWVQLLVSV